MKNRPVTVLCGELTQRQASAPVLRLNIHGARGDEHKLDLALEDITVPMAANLPPQLIDLLEIAAYVFSADQYVRREGRTMSGMGQKWRRAFVFNIPVRALAIWRQKEVTQLLEDTLGFLTDDEFSFVFTPMGNPPKVQSYLDIEGTGANSSFRPDHVLLFSGGLDSLAGAAGLLTAGRKLALVSHRSAPFVQARQNELVECLRDRSARSSVFHVGIRVGKEHAGTAEYTQRSRSFLFASLGAVVAELFGLDEVTFCENGVTSVNLPLATHVLGARATRTTHPRVLASFGEIFSLIARKQIDVVNRYFWNTKTEVLRGLGQTAYADLARASVSCTRTMQMSKSSGRHCGQCSQCVDRFFTMRAAGLAEHDGMYAFDILRGERRSDEHLVLAESYVLSASRWAELPINQFPSAHGELFRIVPSTNMPAPKALELLSDMLRRHGRDVSAVLQEELARESLSAVIGGASRTLLGLTRNQVDPLATKSPLGGASETKPGLPRRIVFAVDDDTFVLEHELRFTGARGRLLLVLRDLRNESPQDDDGFVETGKLVTRLATTQPALRRLIADIRKVFLRHCLTAYGVTPDEDDLIENVPWRGYRLGNRLAEVRSLALRT